jgi:hypothetical protein
LVSPQIQIAGHKLGALVDPDRCREAHFSADSFKHFHNVSTSKAEARLHSRREARERIDDREHAQLSTSCQLIVDKVHGPGLVRSRCRPPIIPELGLDAALGRFVAQLQA